VPDGPLQSQQITAILSRVAKGEAESERELVAVVYEALKQMARAQLARLRPGQSLQATALVHEAWIKLGEGQARAFENRAHFFGASARAMRNILIDQARRRARRPSETAGADDDGTPTIAVTGGSPQLDMLALDEALTELEGSHPRAAQVVMLRFFAGLDLAEVADVLGTSRRTIDREWQFARSTLRRALDATDRGG